MTEVGTSSYFLHEDTERQMRALRPSLFGEGAPTHAPVAAGDRTHNPLRPHTLDEIVGQDKLKRMFRRLIDNATDKREPLDHVLLAGSAGTGKTTLAHVLANELGVDCYQLEAPVDMETLLELREVMVEADVLFIDEVHRQVVPDRRGVVTTQTPEVFYHLLEDRTIVTGSEVLTFPKITVIGATTDIGVLPPSFVDRFPLHPRLESYTEADMRTLAERNATQLAQELTRTARDRLAKAARRNPRQMNNLMRNCATLSDGKVTSALAIEVIRDLNGLTDDGLTPAMQDMLRFLYTRGKRTSAKGEVTYQASVNAIATACGFARDTKAVALYVEPYLIQEGYVQIGHGGRNLTDDGVTRARRL